MNIKQISIFVENKKGRLAEITKVLKEGNIDIRALSIADTKEFGILRLIVRDPDRAITFLKSEGFTVSLTKVIGIGIDDKIGVLSDAMEILSSNDISIEYMYAFIGRYKESAYVIIRVEDNEKAIKLLNDNNFNILKADTLED